MEKDKSYPAKYGDGTEGILDRSRSFVVLQAGSLTPLHRQGVRHCQGPPVLLNGVALSRNLPTVIDTPYREGRSYPSYASIIYAIFIILRAET